MLAGLAAGALLLFVCCDGLPGDQTSPDQESKGDGEGARISDYILVRGDTSGNEVLRQVLELKSAIDERFDTNTRSSTDWAVDAEGANGRVREILVGETNREESVAINAELAGVNGYVIRTVGDKIVITASTTGLLKEAVTFFTQEYILGSEDGALPAQIDVSRKTGLPLGVMSSEDCMRITLSPKASAVLRLTVNDFADRIFELTDLRPLVEFDPAVQNGEVTVFFKDTVFDKPQDGDQSRPGASGGETWQLLREGDRITLKGDGDLQMMAGVAALYEILEERADRTLDGKTVFFYDRGRVVRDSWQSPVPRVVGGGYMGSENIASDSVSRYYENVSLNDLCDWKLLLQEEALGSCVATSNAADNAQFINVRDKLEINVYYDSEQRTLTVNERKVS